MRKTTVTTLSFLQAAAILSCHLSPLDAQESPAELLKKASAIYLDLSRTLSPDKGYPRRIEEGIEWETTPPTGWTSGFFPGILWQLYEYTGDEALLVQAKRWTEGLEDQKTASTHDVGFMIFNSFGRGYRATGSEKYKSVALEAAEHLVSRFNPRVGAIRSWDWDRFTYPVIVDNMMNLELLFWAARTNGDTSLADVAKTHAMTTIRDHVREDGSTYHVVDYRPQTGEIISRVTVQGFADDSMWARGQAWGLYGFTVAYRGTKESVFLETARRLADRFLERLPEDGIPYWDFDAPQESSEPKDASAAAIAASGLWELASLVNDANSRDRYRAASKSLVQNLSSARYSARGAGLPAMLLHSTGNKPGDSEVDVPIIYADYYFIEVLMRQISADSSR